MVLSDYSTRTLISSQVGGFGEIKKLQISSQSLSQSFFPSRTYTKFSHDTVSLSLRLSLHLSLSLSLSHSVPSCSSPLTNYRAAAFTHVVCMRVSKIKPSIAARLSLYHSRTGDPAAGGMLFWGETESVRSCLRRQNTPKKIILSP